MRHSLTARTFHVNKPNVNIADKISITHTFHHLELTLFFIFLSVAIDLLVKYQKFVIVNIAPLYSNVKRYIFGDILILTYFLGQRWKYKNKVTHTHTHWPIQFNEGSNPLCTACINAFLQSKHNSELKWNTNSIVSLYVLIYLHVHILYDSAIQFQLVWQHKSFLFLEI